MAAALLLLLDAAACGKKGPPLAPLVRVPARVSDLAARRLGSDVYLTFTIPDANNDGSRPADLDRIEVYGYTGRLPSNEELLEHGTLVARVKVNTPQPASQDRSPSPSPPSDGGLEQGAVTTLSETLTAESLAPSPAEPAKPQPATLIAEIAPPLVLGSGMAALPGRTYVAVGVNHRGRRGPPSAPALVPLVDAPPAPAAPAVSYTEDSLVVEWTAPAAEDATGDPAADAALLPARPLVPLVRTAFNIYDATPKVARSTPSAASAPLEGIAPLNEQPIFGSSFRDNRLAFGVERCYRLRTLSIIGTLRLESDGSPPACATPRDIFPPAAPRSLVAVAGEGSISLIWEPNTEKDLAGYLILRGEAPGEKLQALTPTPIRETTYRDSTIQSGVRYVYAIVAVDSATPPNLSAHSNRVEETSR